MFLKFIDEIEVRVRSGAGGPGMVSFKTARNVPKLGADGGDGGFGGHVFFQGDRRLNSLSHLRHNRLYPAGKGATGGPNGRTGRNGEDCIIRVPLGTVVKDKDSCELVTEVLDCQPIQVALGGKRGLGNRRYLSSTRQAPEEFTGGGEGKELSLRLELKLIADIGLVGFPNAGKSTLLSAISEARPKIAAYPFTTLEPHLGVVRIGDGWENSFVVADIPGLLEGASQGKGLGFRFLKHIERTKALVFIVDVNDPKPLQTYRQLANELKSFSPDLIKKPSLVVLSKLDICQDSMVLDQVQTSFAEAEIKVITVSAATNLGLKTLKYEMSTLVEQALAEIEVMVAQDCDEYEWVAPPIDFPQLNSTSAPMTK